MKRSPALHPFLFAVFPILFLFTNNIDKMPVSVIYFPILSSLCFASIFFLVLGLLLKDIKKAAMLLTIFLIIFFSYGHFYNLIKDDQVAGFVYGRHRYFLPIITILFSLSTYRLVKTKKELSSVTSFLNAVGAILITISLVNIGVFEYQSRDIKSDSKAPDKKRVRTVNLTENTELPDIYYIILDGYDSDSTLDELYDYDNSSFSTSLKNKGFYLPSKSRSNYAQTWLSLSSSLNMEYVNYLYDQFGEDDKSWIHLEGLIKNNKVLNFLKERGYKTINFNSGYTLTLSNKYADVEIGCGGFGEFFRVLVLTTIASAVEDSLIGEDTRDRILCTFSKLGEMPEVEGPKFVFAHIVSPHPPNVFGRDGERLSKSDRLSRGNDWQGNYLNQLIFINKKIDELVDKLLTKSKKPPIIIIQSDHGSLSTFNDSNNERLKNAGWAEPNETNMKERMRIFNAYYLPDGGNDILYDTMTPVNSFRLIFNEYLGSDFKKLDDISYWSNYEHPYVFEDVTKIVDYDD